MQAIIDNQIAFIDNQIAQLEAQKAKLMAIKEEVAVVTTVIEEPEVKEPAIEEPEVKEPVIEEPEVKEPVVGEEKSYQEKCKEVLAKVDVRPSTIREIQAHYEVYGRVFSPGRIADLKELLKEAGVKNIEGNKRKRETYEKALEAYILANPKMIIE